MSACESKYFTKELILRAQNNDKEALNELVEKNKPLVNSLLKKYLQFSSDYDDLFQIGAMGLIKAIKRFDLSYKTQFSTYAVYVIDGELKRHLRDEGIIKVSRKLRSVYIKVRTEIEKNVKLYGVEPTISQLSESVGEKCEVILEAMDACRKPDYLQDKISGDDLNEKTNEDYIADCDDDILKMIDRITLKEAIQSLEADERKLIVMRYFKNMTQSQVAKVMNTSQVQISRAEKKILNRIKEIYNA